MVSTRYLPRIGCATVEAWASAGCQAGLAGPRVRRKRCGASACILRAVMRADLGARRSKQVSPDAASETVCAHLRRLHMPSGRCVTVSQVIAKSGAWVCSTAPRLHCEFRGGGRAFDPLKIAQYQYVSERTPAPWRAIQAFAMSAAVNTHAGAAMGGASGLASAAAIAEVDLGASSSA